MFELGNKIEGSVFFFPPSLQTSFLLSSSLFIMKEHVVVISNPEWSFVAPSNKGNSNDISRYVNYARELYLGYNLFPG